MPLRSNWSSQNCPIARSLNVLGDPWVMLVLRQALSGVRRFEQFRDQLGVAACDDACPIKTSDVPATSTS